MDTEDFAVVQSKRFGADKVLTKSGGPNPWIVVADDDVGKHDTLRERLGDQPKSRSLRDREPTITVDDFPR